MPFFRASRAAKQGFKEHAQNEVETYQSLVGNILMMGTLVFGFCATGTFLSVSFTGDEAWDNAGDFVEFLRKGCSSAICSLLATLIAFIFSTRVANQQMQYGYLVAYRTVLRSTMFVVFAEMLLFFSLHEFMSSIFSYTQLEYQGPTLCPQGQGQPDDRPDLFYNNSFCAQVGETMYNTASRMCGPRMPVNVTEREDYPTLGPHRLVNDVSHPFSTCTAFDYYTWEYDGYFAGIMPYWFAWDFEDSGYWVMLERHQMTEHQAFFRVNTEIADEICGSSAAVTVLDASCAGAGSSTAACSQARIAALLADSCSGAKQDDAVKCRRVCQWVADGEDQPLKPLKTVIHDKLEFWMTMMLYIIRISIMFRILAGIVRVVKNFQELYFSEISGGVALVVDVFGVCDEVDGCQQQEDMDDPEDGSDDEKRTFTTLGREDQA